MAVKKITLGHPDGSHRDIQLLITASTLAGFPQEVTIRDSEGNVLLTKSGTFMHEMAEHYYKDHKTIDLTVELSHSNGKEHTGIHETKTGHWRMAYNCEDGIDNNYTDLIVHIMCKPEGFEK
jgi:nitrogen fixation protein FixH